MNVASNEPELASRYADTSKQMLIVSIGLGDEVAMADGAVLSLGSITRRGAC